MHEVVCRAPGRPADAGRVPSRLEGSRPRDVRDVRPAPRVVGDGARDVRGGARERLGRQTGVQVLECARQVVGSALLWLGIIGAAASVEGRTPLVPAFMGAMVVGAWMLGAFGERRRGMRDGCGGPRDGAVAGRAAVDGGAADERRDGRAL